MMHFTNIQYLMSLVIGIGIFYVGYLGYNNQPIPQYAFIGLMVIGGLSILVHAYCYMNPQGKESYSITELEEEKVKIGGGGRPLRK